MQSLEVFYLHEKEHNYTNLRKYVPILHQTIEEKKWNTV